MHVTDQLLGHASPFFCRPYLLIAADTGIFRMNLDGTNYTALVNESGVTALDYHYRYAEDDQYSARISEELVFTVSSHGF